MNFIIDFIVLAIIIITAYISARYGFVRTLIEVVGFIAIILIVNSTSVLIAEKIYEKSIENKIEASISGDTIDSIEAVDNVWNSIPKVFTKDNNIFGLKKQNIVNVFNNNLKNNVDTFTSGVSRDVIKPVIIKPLSLIVSIILFFILNFFVHLIAKIINRIIARSFVGGINRKLGFIIGIPKGILLALLFLLFLLLIAAITDNGIWLFTNDAINSSFFVNQIHKILPNNGIFSYLINV